MFEYFYNEIFRSVIIAFGSVFNGIEVRHKDENNDTFSIVKVPLSYGPMQKFLARMQQEANLNKPIQMTLPRMSFEFTNLSYDSSRKSTRTTQIINQTPDGEKIKSNYMPVPYNMTFQLNIMTKLNDDMLQIIEQILPYFQPHYTLTVKFLGNLEEKRDIPIQLDDITMTDDYEGNFDQRRALIYTLTFTAKTFLFGPVEDVTGSIIKKVTVGYLADTTLGAERDITYTVTPRAVKDYDGDGTTYVSDNIDLTTQIIPVGDSSDLAVGTYIYVDQEEMFISKIDGNTLTVKRAQDNSKAGKHVSGAAVHKITKEDNAAIQFGDDFGFSGSYS